MIKSAVVAMVVLGCDCDQKLCEYISETPAKWSTIADCEAAMKHQMLTDKTYDYPVVTGLCRAVETTASVNPQPVAPTAYSEAATVALAPPADPAVRRPSAAVGVRSEISAPVYAGLVEGGRSVLFRTAGGYTVVKNSLGRVAMGTAEMVRRTSGRLIGKLSSF